MPWSGTPPNQTFTRTDGTRTGDTTWNQAKAASVKIVAAGHDTHDTDMKDGLNAALKKDGGNSPTANINWGGNKVTNLGAATADTDALSRITADGRYPSLSGATFTGGVTVGGTLIVESTTPEFRLRDSDAAADGKIWRDQVAGVDRTFTVYNDALSAFETWLKITRSGATITLVDFLSLGASELQRASNVIWDHGNAATAAEYRANTANARGINPAAAWSAADLVALTDAATIAVDMATFLNATVTLAGNRTLGAPTNTKVGQAGVILIKQDATGSRTLAYNAVWKFPGATAPTLTTAASRTDKLFYVVESSTIIHAEVVKDSR